MRLWLPILIVGLGTSACGRGESRTATADVHVLPAAALQDLDGRATNLTSFAQGRVALVSFWATWCDSCLTEMNALNRLSAEADRRRDAVVVGVAVGEERTKVRAFGQAHQLAYSLLVDSDFALTDALGERRVPTTLVVDRQGRIVFRGGALDAASLAAFRDTVSSTP